MFEEAHLPDGTIGFRKFSRGGADARYFAEAAGLAALASTGAVLTPRVYAVSETELITGLISQGAASTAGWAELGRQLAALQAIPQPGFGFTGDNFCGDTPQPNPRYSDGHAFFAEQRLLYQGQLAFEARLLDATELAALEGICARLVDLVPAQPPALLHGDLWRGNVLFNEQGRPVLIDPACYWGWAEAEIGRTALFGGFPEAFYASWASASEPQPGWRERLPLYNVYHLLNHLNLFGPSYHPGVVEILRRFS